MLRFNFDFLKLIEPNLWKYLNIAQNSIATDPHNTMAKVRACMEFISKDMIIKYNKIHGENFKVGTLNENILRLRKNKVLDSKSQSACDVARHACNEVVHSLEADSEWAQLCLSHMNIFCKWYAKKYYNIESKEEVMIVDYAGPVQEYTAVVKYEEARQAYMNLNIEINDKEDALLVLASANLLNAYVKQKDAIIIMKPKYIFKQILVNRLEEIIKKRIDGVDIYFNTDITYIKIYDLQFSFHYLAPNEFMKKYMNSRFNQEQKWSGIRLQPCAGIIFNRAMEYRGYSNKVC